MEKYAIECDKPEPINTIQERSTECRDVNIKKAVNGFIVKVGCATFVSKEWSEVSEALQKYWNDPIATEKEYMKK